MICDLLLASLPCLTLASAHSSAVVLYQPITSHVVLDTETRIWAKRFHSACDKVFLPSSAEFIFILLFCFHNHTSSGDISAVLGLPQLRAPGSDGLIWLRRPLLAQCSGPCSCLLRSSVPSEQDWHQLTCRLGKWHFHGGGRLAGAAPPAPRTDGGEPECRMGLREESPDGSRCPWAVHLPLGHVLSRADQVSVLFSSVSLKGKLHYVGGLLPCFDSVIQGVNTCQNGTCSTGWHTSPCYFLGCCLNGGSRACVRSVCWFIQFKLELLWVKSSLCSSVIS